MNAARTCSRSIPETGISPDPMTRLGTSSFGNLHAPAASQNHTYHSLLLLHHLPRVDLVRMPRNHPPTWPPAIAFVPTSLFGTLSSEEISLPCCGPRTPTMPDRDLLLLPGRHLQNVSVNAPADPNFYGRTQDVSALRRIAVPLVQIHRAWASFSSLTTAPEQCVEDSGSCTCRIQHSQNGAINADLSISHRAIHI